MMPWIGRIRDDVPITDVGTLCLRHGLHLEKWDLLSWKHLTCEAPVPSILVHHLKTKMQSVIINNVLPLSPGVTWFDAHPRNYDQTLSDMDHDLGDALGLSDPALLRAHHIGSQYELWFRERDFIVRTARWELAGAGIELGDNYQWLPDASWRIDAASPIHVQ